MNDKPRLTKRELEVLKLRATGLTNQEIADKLFIDIKTVEHHNNRVLAELGCKRNLVKAIYHSYELGILVPPFHGNLQEAFYCVKQVNELATKAKIIFKQYDITLGLEQ